MRRCKAFRRLIITRRGHLVLEVTGQTSTHVNTEQGPQPAPPSTSDAIEFDSKTPLGGPDSEAACVDPARADQGKK